MPSSQLSALQLAVMEVLWQRSEATVAEVHAALDRDLAVTTVGTILARLAKQGTVAHRKEGRTYLYRPQLSQRAVQRSMTSRLLDSLFGGDPAALVSHLLREDELTGADLERLRNRLDALETGEPDAADAPIAGDHATEPTNPDSTDA